MANPGREHFALARFLVFVCSDRTRCTVDSSVPPFPPPSPSLCCFCFVVLVGMCSHFCEVLILLASWRLPTGEVNETGVRDSESGPSPVARR